MVKRRLLAVLGAAAMGSIAALPAAHAAPYVWTAVASVGVDERGVFVDFSDSSCAPGSGVCNPTPVHNWVFVHNDGTVSCGNSGEILVPSSDPNNPGRPERNPYWSDPHTCNPAP